MTRLEAALYTTTFVMASAMVRANEWNCRNDVEVQCTATSCEVAQRDDFTPMDLTFDADGKFSLCAYSGCWEGTGKVIANSPFLIIAAKQVNWSDPERKIEGREDVLIAFHYSDHVAMVKAGTLMLPMHCIKTVGRK